MRFLDLVSMAICKSSASQSILGFFETYRDFSRFLWFLWISQFFSQSLPKIMDFYKYLDRDFITQFFLFTFCVSKWAKSVGNSIFFQKVSTKISIISKNHGYLDWCWWSWLVSTISIKILTQPSLDWKVWILKISIEKKKFGLDCRENLDTLKKLVSTQRTFSISISNGADCWDPQAYLEFIITLK